MSHNNESSHPAYESYDILDLTKLILSILVVCIHTQLFPAVLHPWVRVAVPLFFLMSSFFFFQRINILDKQSRSDYLKKYIKRNLQLYIFYFVLLLPITIFRHGYLNEPPHLLFLIIFRDFVFGSTFFVSWFIMASIEGTIFVFFLSKHLPEIVVIGIGVIGYLFGCMTSVYSSLFENNAAVQSFLEIYHMFFLNPYNNVNCAILWIAIGKLMASFQPPKSSKKEWGALFLFALLLEIEFLLTKPHANLDDCYIMMLPFAVVVFRILLTFRQVKIRNAAIFRKISTMVYAFHGSAMVVLKVILKRVAPNLLIAPILFMLTIIVSSIYVIIILKLENRRKLKFLRFAH